MSTTRYFNVKGFKIGATTYTGIKSVTYRETYTRIAGVADSDLGVTFQARGSNDNEVTIAMEDPIQAQAIKDAAVGDITFGGMTKTGGTEKIVTIKNFQTFGRGGNDAHDRLNTLSVSGHGYDPTGAGVVITEAAGSITD